MSHEVLWFVAGLAMLSIDLFGGLGLTLAFFGVGAWVTSIVCMIEPIDQKIQWIIFAAVSIITLAALRRMIKRHFFDDKHDTPDHASRDELSEEYVGQTAEAEMDFNAGQIGRVNFRGATWKALTTGDIKKGELVQITDIDSITLHVESRS